MRSTGLPNRVHEDPRDIRGAYRGLCCAICEMAVKDYRKHLRLGSKSGIATLEKFFRSEWFFFLTDGNIDGEAVIQEVRRQWAKEQTSRRSLKATARS